MPAIVDALRSPQKIASAGVKDLNSNLEALLRDLDSQSSRRHDLGKMVAHGPLANIPKQLNHTLNNVKGGSEVRKWVITCDCAQLFNCMHALTTTLPPSHAIVACSTSVKQPLRAACSRSIT